MDWNAYIGTLAPKGRLVYVGATLEPLDLNVFGLILKEASVSGSAVGSPETITTMLDFANLHGVKPQIEIFPMDQVNQAIERMKSGDVHYRVVFSNQNEF